ncbi:hypothetical protein EES45_00155 [Streptomyces sp. ADI97-07]|nr:hypothetical protein EES45_00155 [Streptomyces sp. ADI97-07]
MSRRLCARRRRPLLGRPYLADLVTLPRVPAQRFGLLLSVNPAVVSWIVLGQNLGWTAWAAIVTANANALSMARRPVTPDRRAPQIRPALT